MNICHFSKSENHYSKMIKLFYVYYCVTITVIYLISQGFGIHWLAGQLGKVTHTCNTDSREDEAESLPGL